MGLLESLIMNVNVERNALLSAEVYEPSVDVFNDDFSRFALGQMKIAIQEDYNSRLITYAREGFSNWCRDCDGEELEQLFAQYNHLVKSMDSRAPFSNVFSHRVVANLNESSFIIDALLDDETISEASICDFDCASGSRLMNVMEHFYRSEGAKWFEDKEFVICSLNESSLRMALVQFLFHLHKYNIQAVKISAFVFDNFENTELSNTDLVMSILGTCNQELNYVPINHDHDCVITETENMILLTA